MSELNATGGTIHGVSGDVLEPSGAQRGAPSTRAITGQFALDAQAVIITSGGIGGNHDLVRQSWPDRLGQPPRHMLSGVPDHVDGRMLAITQNAGGTVINRDRMWHYVDSPPRQA